MYAILVSEEDPAGRNIREKLLESGRFRESGAFDGHPAYAADGARLLTLDTLHIYSEDLHNRIDADNIIFATTHKSVQNTRSLSVHVIGNWGKAEMGGKDRQVSWVNPALNRKLFTVLAEEAEGMDYEATLEATHHGPYLETPSAFIEIGSTEKEWNDPEAGRAIARTILRVMDEGLPAVKEASFGLGGTHYCRMFNKRVLNDGEAVGHICPKYALENFDENLLDQCISRSSVPITHALLEWKGLGPEKKRIIELLEEKNIEIRR